MEIRITFAGIAVVVCLGLIDTLAKVFGFEPVQDPHLLSFILLSVFVSGFLFGWVVDVRLTMKNRTRFIDLLFSSDCKSEEMLTAQAVICEAASQEIIQFQRSGLGSRDEDFETHYDNLKDAFKTQQELFYLMYDIEMERRSTGEHSGVFEKRSFKEWLPSTTSEG